MANYSSAVLLVNDDIRVVACSYLPEPSAPNAPQYHQLTADDREVHGKRYQFKTLDKTIKVGDYVVVPTGTRHFMTVVRVEETDSDVDFDSNIQLKWIICKVDTETVKSILAKEQEWVEKLQKVERASKKEELRKKLLGAKKIEGINLLEATKQHDATTIELTPPAPVSDESPI